MRSTVHVMNKHGDQKISWDPDDKESKIKAAAKLEALEEEGYRFFIDGERTKAKDLINERVTSVIAVAPMAGG